MNTYTLEKAIWTDADFDKMSWHDNPIHGICFDRTAFQLLIDSEYIFEWKLSKRKRYFNFWISPCTLVFDFVSKISFDGAGCDVVITDVSREALRKIDGPLNLTDYNWELETANGGLNFNATGYKQYVRKTPVLLNNQIIDMEQRGGDLF